MPGRNSGNGAVCAIASANYEQKVIAAMVRQAVNDARSGDVAACQWLIHDAAEWLEWLASETTDLRAVHEKIVRLGGAERAASDAERTVEDQAIPEKQREARIHVTTPQQLVEPDPMEEFLNRQRWRHHDDRRDVLTNDGAK